MKKRLLVLLILGLSSLQGCQMFHDTTARYNAYFLAKERMKIVEDTLFYSQKDDFNNILHVLPVIDSTVAKAQQANLEYCLKKASLPIRWHETSKWVDDCYLIIGKARLYQGDFVNASSTFRYINAESDDPNTRHQALIGLLKTFTVTDQYTSVEQVLEGITQEPYQFSDENIKDFYLAAADYYRRKRNYDYTAQYLEKAVSLVRPKSKQARYYFILGQIYQELGDFDKSFENYQKTLTSNPAYELAFNARLNSSRVFNPTDKDDIKDTERFFKKMLVDQKNEEYKDRIYYEMGNFEVRKGHISKGMEYFNQSLAFSTLQNNVAQKTYTYIRMGEVYFQEHRFEKATNYYDSASFILTPQMKDYNQVMRRVNVLREFIEKYKIVETQKRLLNLSKMSDEELSKFFEEEIAREKKEIDDNIAKNEAILEAQSRNQTQNTTTNSTSSWYFYNPTAVNTGKATFAREWGGRALEDNWRRSQKSSFAIDNNTQDENGENTENGLSEAEKMKQILYASLKSVAERKAEVPKSPQAIAKAQDSLANAMFYLGKIYYQKLEENDAAVSTLQQFTNRFPTNKHTPEALFLLHTICTKIPACEADTYDKKLRQLFPEAHFTKLLDNKHIADEAQQKNAEVTQKYEEAYKLYQEGTYTKAQEIIATSLENYPLNEHADKFTLLNAMIIGKTTNNLDIYVKELNAFIRDYTDSPLVPFAQDLLKVAKGQKN